MKRPHWRRIRMEAAANQQTPPASESGKDFVSREFSAPGPVVFCPSCPSFAGGNLRVQAGWNVPRRSDGGEGTENTGAISAPRRGGSTGWSPVLPTRHFQTGSKPERCGRKSGPTPPRRDKAQRKRSGLTSGRSPQTVAVLLCAPSRLCGAPVSVQLHGSG